MTKPRISIVVAVTRKDAAIGNGGKLLVRISDDLKRFKAITKGHPVIMGRKTFESIGRPLPERTNFVVTRNPDFKAANVIAVSSLEEAIAQAGALDSEVFLVGGGEIYKQGLPYTDKLYLTLVDSDAEGDVFFPDWRKDFTKETFREERLDEKTGLKYTWVDLERASEPIPVVAILIVKNDKVLLVKHTNSKHIEGIYGLPGGKLEAGETEAQGAKRELFEETGLSASLADLVQLPTLWIADVTFKNGSVRTCSMRVFLCKHYAGEIRGTEHELPEWLPFAEVKNLTLLPHVENAIREGLKFKN